jgi:hypothetical protein
VRNERKRLFKSDTSAWIVMGLIVGAVTLALWAPVVWESLNG